MKIYTINGQIELLSGLHIGGGDTEMHIGGVDNAVIKDPLTKKPIIPGSSLKGKVKTLLEYFYNIHLYCHKNNSSDYELLNIKHLDNIQDDETKNKAINVIKYFGAAGTEKTDEYGVSRFVFRDCYLSDDSARALTDLSGSYTEIKAETAIDRKTGTALRGSLRLYERVPRGAKFDFAIGIRCFKDDNIDEMQRELLTGLKLLTYDTLGGSGSRGYGSVKITFDDNTLQEQFDKLTL